MQSAAASRRAGSASGSGPGTASGSGPSVPPREYITLPEALAVRLPEHTSFAEGACLGIPAMTAAHAVAVSGLGPGNIALISGGAGGVGHYAVQFAKIAGASVITTVSSEDKAKLARTAGADHVIDYKRENVGERVMTLTGGRGVDAVIELDLAANAKLLPGVAHARTTVVVYGTGAMIADIPAQFLLTNAITIRFIFVYELTPAERAAALAMIARSSRRGRFCTTSQRRSRSTTSSPPMRRSSRGACRETLCWRSHDRPGCGAQRVHRNGRRR